MFDPSLPRISIDCGFCMFSLNCFHIFYVFIFFCRQHNTMDNIVVLHYWLRLAQPPTRAHKYDLKRKFHWVLVYARLSAEEDVNDFECMIYTISSSQTLERRRNSYVRSLQRSGVEKTCIVSNRRSSISIWQCAFLVFLSLGPMPIFLHFALLAPLHARWIAFFEPRERRGFTKVGTSFFGYMEADFCKQALVFRSFRDPEDWHASGPLKIVPTFANYRLSMPTFEISAR